MNTSTLLQKDQELLAFFFYFFFTINFVLININKKLSAINSLLINLNKN